MNVFIMTSRVILLITRYVRSSQTIFSLKSTSQNLCPPPAWPCAVGWPWAHNGTHCSFPAVVGAVAGEAELAPGAGV